MIRKWTFDELTKKLADVNQKWAAELRQHSRISLPRGSGCDSKDGDDIPRSASIVGRVNEEHRCFCGLLKRKSQTPIGLARRCLILQSAPTTLHGVLNVLDKGTQQTNQKIPVVVCVGINYGQVPGSIGSPLIDDTKMRLHAIGAVQQLTRICQCSSAGLPSIFHLVATNFFPWLSLEEWTDLKINSIEEALLLHCFGFRNPVTLMNQLLITLNPHLVFFHGAGSCVSSLAMATVRQAGSAGWNDRVIFCDNLSRSVTQNVVGLCN
jgi:hypothetical protein